NGTPVSVLKHQKALVRVILIEEELDLGKKKTRLLYLWSSGTTKQALAVYDLTPITPPPYMAAIPSTNIGYSDKKPSFEEGQQNGKLIEQRQSSIEDTQVDRVPINVSWPSYAVWLVKPQPGIAHLCRSKRTLGRAAELG
ncbi:hypothetical protein U1Q18_012030, partial [Sarracenia purpurea var. burkii]